ncbi:MAG: CRR6 family NdhI maturation factor [Thermosynechococcaceae cyanobacterium]
MNNRPLSLLKPTQSQSFQMPKIIAPAPEHFDTLNLSAAQAEIEPWLKTGDLAEHFQSIQFQINYPQDLEQPLEFPEIPEVRLWFMRLDSVYPWLPLFLDWQSGELVRYAAMLVPHEFSQKEGIQFNPQALDLFVMQKVFVIFQWLRDQNIEGESKLKHMADMFGYELQSPLFKLLR